MQQPKSQDDVHQTYDYEIDGFVFIVPLVDIYVDPSFNCRGHFAPNEVHELGVSIREEGQRAPCIIQPIGDVPEDELPSPCAWKFRLVAGHRRYMAIETWVKQATIKCIIEYGLTRGQAHALNFTENLQRQDLNIMQEAQALVNTWPIEETNQVAKLIGKPKRWVQTRRDLMDLPDYVQRKAAADPKVMTQYVIEMLAGLPAEAIEDAFQKVVATAGKRGKAPVIRGAQPWRSRPRGKGEVGKMIAFLSTNRRFCKLSTDELDYIASTLAWAARRIDSKEFLETRLGFPDGCVIVNSKDTVTSIKR